MCLDDLIGRETRAAEGADLPLADQVAQYRERLLGVSAVIWPMDLVEVYPVGIEAPQALLDLGQDPAPRVAAPVAALAHLEMHLGGQHDLVTPAPERLPRNLLGLARGVHVRGIDEVD